MNIAKLPLKNIISYKKRTIGLILILVILTMSLFGGSIFIKSLNNGLDSLNERLGADIIVLPKDAESEVDLQNLLLQGTPGYFYMDKSILNDLESIEGVDRISAQYFLVSANADCCSVKVQIIGFDEETDFTIKPWLNESYQGVLKDDEIIVGSMLSTKVGHTLKLYGKEFLVVGKLEKTGTGLDTAVYTTGDTVKTLIEAAEDKGISILSKQSPDDVISSVYIDVKDGYDIDTIVSDINLNNSEVKAVRARTMMTSTSDRLGIISSAISFFVKIIWAFAAIILIAAFYIITGERKKEFAALRVIGVSRKKLGVLVMSEAIIIGIIGSVFGIIITGAFMYSFSVLIGTRLDLPYLLPGVVTTTYYILVTFISVVLLGTISGLISAYRAVSVDTARILRE
ncbi:ABC transporter permease [Agathobacter ruminis]|uniref:Putative hemin transport system permease protein HrtB n=1 Tax=Agathobacter ruminis TaxID=1712665 RepID=A0A2G3E540_9FIRM|nr:ABC transporter permease [Agathobacter ruminis]MDC7302125.1 ABC transporter permease [Agathobacter ruminis]PHU38321.1 permease [Agathobacter ruminis]